MANSVWLEWVLAALLALVTVRSAIRVIANRSAERDAELAHLLMGVGMIAMFLPWADPLPRLVWIVAFVLAGAWFVAYLLRGKRSAGELHLMIGNVAMVYMLALVEPGAPQPVPAVALGLSGGWPTSMPAVAASSLRSASGWPRTSWHTPCGRPGVQYAVASCWTGAAMW